MSTAGDQNTMSNPTTVGGMASREGNPETRYLTESYVDSTACIAVGGCTSGHCIVKPTKTSACIVIGCAAVSAIVIAVYFYIFNKD